MNKVISTAFLCFFVVLPHAVVAQDYAEALEEVDDIYSGIVSTISDTDAHLKDAEDKYKQLKECMGSGPEGRECQAWIDLLYNGPGGIELQDKVVEVKGKVQAAIREIEAAGVPGHLTRYRNQLGLIGTAATSAKGALDFTRRFNPEGARGDPTRGLRLIGEIIGGAAGKLPKPLDEIFGEYAKAAAAFAKRLTALAEALDNARQGSLCGSYSKYADAQEVFERDYAGANNRVCLTFLDVTDQFRLLSRLGIVFADQDGDEYYLYESSTKNGWIARSLFASVYKYYEATGRPTLLTPSFRMQRLTSVSSANSTPARLAQISETYQILSRSGRERDKILEFHELLDDANELVRLGTDAFFGFYLFDPETQTKVDRIRDVLENTVYVTGTVMRGSSAAVGEAISLLVGSFGSQVTSKEYGSFEVFVRGKVGDRFTIYAGSGTEQYKEESRFVGTASIEGLVINLNAADDEASEVTVDPATIELSVGETASFTASAVMLDGSVRDVTDVAAWSNGPGFTATESGAFVVTASYLGKDGAGTITVVLPTDEDCEPDGTEDCPCAEPSEWNEALGECTSLEDALDEVTEGEEDLCSAEDLQAGADRVAELTATALDIGSAFDASSARFFKEIADQNANVCINSLLAASYSGARSLAERSVAIEQEITAVATDLIVRTGICPNVSLDTSQIIGFLAQTGDAFGVVESTIITMESELNAYGCDLQEVEDLGEQIAENETDPDIIAAGGVGAVEICGDGIDNDGDGLLDEECETQGNFNVTIILFDSGSAADDIFDLSVTGQGNLGSTPEGSSRTYPLALSPGDYVATVFVTSAPDDTGTYTITIAEGDRVLASSTGAPPQGATASISFTVGDPTSGEPALRMHSGDEILQGESIRQLPKQ